MMSIIIDYLNDDLHGIVKERCIEFFHDQEIRSNLKDWLKCQKENYESGCFLGNIDFSGFEDYVTSQIIKDTVPYLYGKSEEQAAAKWAIMAKAIESAGANDEASRKNNCDDRFCFGYAQ